MDTVDRGDMAYDPVVAPLTLAASLLSATSTACVLLCFTIWHAEHRSFRHALVLNLALSDFINSLNNSVSGVIYVRDHSLWPGPACTFNGWIAQVSVQATDFSILAISLSTLFVVTRRTSISETSIFTKLAICLSVWIVPIITSTAATSLGAMRPVSGNWCWITRERIDLRYGLTHAWRFAIILATISIYTYILWHVSKGFKQLRNIAESSGLGTTFVDTQSGGTVHDRKDNDATKQARGGIELNTLPKPLASPNPLPSPEVHVEMTVDVSVEEEQDSEDEPRYHRRASDEETLVPTRSAMPVETATGFHDLPPHQGAPWQHADKPRKGSLGLIASKAAAAWSAALNRTGATNAGTTVTSAKADTKRIQKRRVEREIKRMLLLNGYPILYVILWIPGLLNRILEATGFQDSRVLGILQCPTQFVGFANSVTYGVVLLWRDRKSWKRRS